MGYAARRNRQIRPEGQFLSKQNPVQPQLKTTFIRADATEPKIDQSSFTVVKFSDRAYMLHRETGQLRRLETLS